MKKQKALNPDAFKQKQNEAKQKYKKKQKDLDPDSFKQEANEALQKYRKKVKENVDETARINNFNRAVIFGPIFTCSCCSRQMYENGVTKITANWKDKLDLKKPGFYQHCIPKEEHVEIFLNGSDALSGYYICTTCKSSITAGKVPSMATINGLYLTEIGEDCHLTELENNLIAQNINFQYIFCLKKSRWAATKKQMISVPVAVDTVINTIEQLPRLPRQAGLIPVNLKRKKIYKNSHKTEYIDPDKIFRVLKHLK